MMPKKTRFKMMMVLAAGGSLLATGATAPAEQIGKRPPNGMKTPDTTAVALVVHKRPPNG